MRFPFLSVAGLVGPKLKLDLKASPTELLLYPAMSNLSWKDSKSPTFRKAARSNLAINRARFLSARRSDRYSPENTLSSERSPQRSPAGGAAAPWRRSRLCICPRTPHPRKTKNASPSPNTHQSWTKISKTRYKYHQSIPRGTPSPRKGFANFPLIIEGCE